MNFLTSRMWEEPLVPIEDEVFSDTLYNPSGPSTAHKYRRTVGEPKNGTPRRHELLALGSTLISHTSNLIFNIIYRKLP